MSVPQIVLDNICHEILIDDKGIYVAKRGGDWKMLFELSGASENHVRISYVDSTMVYGYGEVPEKYRSVMVLPQEVMATEDNFLWETIVKAPRGEQFVMKVSKDDQSLKEEIKLDTFKNKSGGTIRRLLKKYLKI